MTLLELALIVATLLSALTAGFVFSFASVVMPGIGNLTDKEFIRAFQAIDGVIQAGQPFFGLVWIGSVIALVAAAILAVLQLEGIVPTLVVASTIAYALGVQLTTFRINVPLNNALQMLNVDDMGELALDSARRSFEHRWVRWNLIRTVVASVVSVSLMLVLLWL
ncbi:anthrone oxygenase family protein [Marinobacter sp. PE14]